MQRLRSASTSLTASSTASTHVFTVPAWDLDNAPLGVAAPLITHLLSLHAALATNICFNWHVLRSQVSSHFFHT